MIPFKTTTLDKMGMVDCDKPLAFDTETIGLYGKIRLAQFYQEDWDSVLLVNNPDPMLLATFLNKHKVVMHNAHYDITCIQAATESRYEPKDYEDTFLLARLKFYNKEKFALDDVMGYVLGYAPYAKAGIDKKTMQKASWDLLAIPQKQLEYAAIDVYYLLDVYNAVKDKSDTTSYNLDMKTLSYCLDFQNNGMPVLDELLQQRYAENIAEVESYALPINVNSYQQVRPYIGSDQSDDLGLATLAIKGNIKANNVRVVRKLLKQNSFLNKFDTMLGSIYGKFKPSARSGRLTSNDQNLQQIPRKTNGLFGYTTEEGKVLVYADYAQLEMRCICAITGELKMDGLLRAGEDLHDFTAKMLFGDNFTPEQRQVAKTANFGLLYGAGVKVFLSILIKQADLMLSEHEGSITKRKWRTLWGTIAKWQDQGMTDWRSGKPWATPFGRMYTAKRSTDQLNIANQGFGAEVAKLALHYMMPELKALPEEWEVRLLNFIHDSYIVSCINSKEAYEEVSMIIANAMQTAWFEALRTGIDLKIRDLPMPVDVFVGYNWGAIEKDYLYKYSLEGTEYYAQV